MLPAVLKKAYAAYAPRTGNPDPLFFDPAETWRFPTTVTFLVLSMNGFSFRAQGIYRIRRQYFKAEDTNGSGQYRVSQDLIWKVQTQGHSPFHLSLHTAFGAMGEDVSGVPGCHADCLPNALLRVPGNWIFLRLVLDVYKEE